MNRDGWQDYVMQNHNGDLIIACHFCGAETPVESGVKIVTDQDVYDIACVPCVDAYEPIIAE